MMELTPREVAATDQELAGFTESRPGSPRL